MKQFTHKLRDLTRACLCGGVTGIVTAAVIVFYKVCAKTVIALSETGYHYLREHLYWIPLVLLCFAGLAPTLAAIYRRHPYMRGGGIPTSVGILRDFISFEWLRNLIGIFTLSLFTFLIGTPLGNEGPSVQMGTSVGRGVTRMLPRSYRVFDRYAMTGGACAGFSSATGAPISGILFAVEEAHGRLTPLVLLVSAVSVLTARAVTEWLAPLCGVSVSLLPALEPVVLVARELWLPLLVGAVVGLFSVLFLKYYRVLYRFLHPLVKRYHHAVMLFGIFVLTLAAGLCHFSLVSTGHELILELLFDTPLLPLLLILAVRATLTLSANTVGATGGVFVPILALGALASAMLSRILESVFSLPGEYGVVILLLGVTACVAGTMKMPLTAVVFAVEALSCADNLLPVITAAFTAYAITELFGAHSINDHVLERKLDRLNADKTAQVYDTFVTVEPGSFAEAKQIREILWPANLFVLSVRQDPKKQAQVDEHGGRILSAGDVLHVRYSTFDEPATREELIAIVGDQQYAETRTDSI